MKKLKTLASSFALLTLTSCDVHFGSRHYDVPWYIIAVPVAVWTILIFLAVWIIGGKSFASHKYVCQECGEKFYPKWWIAGVSVHENNDLLYRCPHCGKRGFCPRSWDE